jgi:hypothetical protein
MSRMATRTVLPAKPTLGSQEWLRKSMTGSYSASSTAARWKPSAIWTSELRSRSGKDARAAVLTMWPPLIATSSPAAIGATAMSPRSWMVLTAPLRALGVM